MDELTASNFFPDDFLELSPAAESCPALAQSVVQCCRPHEPVPGELYLAYRLLTATQDLLVDISYVSTRVRKRIENLSVRSQEIFLEIRNRLPTDHDLREFHRRQKNLHKDLGHKCSGRTFDTLVTSAYKYMDCSYFLDITNRHDITILQDCEEPIPPDRRVIRFDIQASYRQKMYQYSKRYFDCFARGDVIEHQLSDGTNLDISLCQFMFFLWVFEFKIDQFLLQNYPKVVEIRRFNQTQNYKPKKKKRKQIHIESRNPPGVKIGTQAFQRRNPPQLLHLKGPTPRWRDTPKIV